MIRLNRENPVSESSFSLFWPKGVPDEPFQDSYSPDLREEHQKFVRLTKGETQYADITGISFLVGLLIWAAGCVADESGIDGQDGRAGEREDGNTDASPPPDGPRDAMRNVQSDVRSNAPHDARSDVSRDAGPDAARDAGPDAAQDAGPDVGYTLVVPECVTPADNTLFQPSAEGTFSPLEWTTSEGATYSLSLWQLPQADSLLGEGTLVFEGDVGSAGSTAGITSFPSLDYRTDYLWVVQACSVYDPTECVSSIPCRFTTTEQGLIGWWRFDAEEISETGRDWSGNGNNGTLMGADGPPAWMAGGVSGGALLFDGVDDYVIMGDQDIFEGMGALTVEAWVNTMTMEGNRPLVAKWWSSPDSYTLRTDPMATGRISFYTETALPPISSTSIGPINDGSWHHVVGTYDGSLQQIYVDGVLQTSTEQSGTILDSEEELCFGAFCDPVAGINSFFNGSLDEVALYNRALSDAEIYENCQRHDPTGATCP